MTGRAYRRFFVVAQRRSGSTLLTERLHSHPNIVCYGEVANAREVIWHPAAPPEGTFAPIPADRDPTRFLETHVWRDHPPNIAAVGMKVLDIRLLSGPSPLRDHLCAAGDASVLLLGRENLLELFVSTVLAERTGQWFLFDQAERPKAPGITVACDQLEMFFRVSTLARLALARLFAGRRVLELSYEALATAPEREDARLCAFLDVPRAALSHSSVKMQKRAIPELIQNYGALKRHFGSGEWARFFP